MLKQILDKLVNFHTEPVRAVARLTSALAAVVSLAALWGFPISDQTQTAILTTAPILIIVLNGAAEFARQFVTPVPVAYAAIGDALAIDPKSPVMTTPAKVLESAAR